MTNEEILNLIEEKKSLYSSIKMHRNRLIRHTLRHKGPVGIILGGTVGRKREGRQKLEYVKKIIDDVSCNE